MGAPITWRNVEAPDLRGAAAMLNLAGTGINSGFDKLNQVLQNEQATADNNWKVQRDNNTQAFLSSINQYRTPEEYQAAVTSGALDPSKFGAQIDQAAARTALDGRLSVLQDRTTKANQFTDQQKARDAKPIVDQLSMMALSDDKAVRESAKQALGIYASNGMVPDAAILAGNMRTIGQQNVEWDRADRKFKDELLTSGVSRDEKRAHIGYMGAMSEAARVRAEAERASSSSETVSLKAQLAASKQQNAAAELKIKNSPLDAGTMDTYAGQQAFEKALGDLGLNQAQVNSVRQEYSKKYGNGVLVGYDEKGGEVRIGLPVSTALAAVKGSEDDWVRANWMGNSYRGRNAAKQVERLMSEPAYVSSLQEAMQAQGMQYRPLQPGAAAPVSVSATSRATQTARRSIIPSGVDPESSDNPAMAGVLAARLKERAKGMMTPREIEDAKSGKISPRIKLLLETSE